MHIEIVKREVHQGEFVAIRTPWYDCVLQGGNNLKTGSVDDLQVDDDLAGTILDDHDADATTATLEGFLQAAPEVGLVKNGKVLLDITSLGHGNNTLVMEIEDTVLLEDWTKHGLNDDAWAWVGDEGRLFVQLTSEEVDTQVAVLAGGSGGGDPDNLAGTALEHQEITHTDVVAWDGNGVWWWLRLSSGSWGASLIIVVTHVEIEWCERSCWSGRGRRRRLDDFFGDADVFGVDVLGGARLFNKNFVDYLLTVDRLGSVGREG